MNFNFSASGHRHILTEPNLVSFLLLLFWSGVQTHLALVWPYFYPRSPPNMDTAGGGVTQLLEWSLHSDDCVCVTVALTSS